MTKDITIGWVLAESDWQTVAAIIVFTVISIIANWIKKRSDASTSKAGAEGDDEFEPVELFEEPKPLARPTPVARPKLPPKIMVSPRVAESRGKPRATREHSAEAQVRISSILGRSKVQTAHAPGTSANTTLLKQEESGATLQSHEVELPSGKRFGILDFHNPKSLREAVIASELLGPPIALRGESGL